MYLSHIYPITSKTPSSIHHALLPFWAVLLHIIMSRNRALLLAFLPLELLAQPNCRVLQLRPLH